ncbi:MAG: hypothetical protein ASARMPREDX12_003656 [Alectoria sarmentosa]|nr:MAG: hypothetical protein ASARMPREDX12_003656 [Alectoria sarmentosa]
MATLEVHGIAPGPFHSRKKPLRRAPSSGSLGANERPITPTLRKRTSMGSLQGTRERTSPRSPAFRRTSSTLVASPNSTSLGARSNLPPPAEELSHPVATAASVAYEYFKKELRMHDDGVGALQEARTVVILQDDCYDHRYSRPRTSKATLSTIVERPERIHASILGLATAYVRLGERYAGGHAAPHPDRHPASLPPGPFHIRKTSRRMSLTSPAATAIHGTQWMTELSAMCDAAESKLALGGKELTRPNAYAQTNGTSQAEQQKLHEGDLYLCSGSLNALEGALGGVCEGIDAVFTDQGPKRAFVCIRPPGHHCSADMPSGFCWLNNVHVGIGHAALTHGLTHAAIIDFDLHHGDGSQSITWAHNTRIASLSKNTPISKRTAIGYFSLHDINSYPCEMGDEEKIRNASLCIENAHGQTIWNIHLQPWKTDAEFWQLYQDRYSVILSKARNFLRLHSDRLRQAPTHPKPKAAVFLSAGFDASEWESQGMQRHRANVPTDFYARFTRDVVMMAEEEGLGVDGRVVSVLEGGYSDRALMSGVLSHISGLSPATSPLKQRNISNGLGHEIDRTQRNPEFNGVPPQTLEDMPRESVEAIDTTWWSPPRLEEIEALVNPSQPTAALKKQRNDSRPTYTSATQSYTAKIVSPPQGRRSFSGNGAHNYQTASPVLREPRSPPPAVDWATAAHELSKLLVPSDRETRSCKPEDLNAEATRARRDRQSSVGLPVDGSANDFKRMQLRHRKVKPPQHTSDDEQEKPVSRVNRRKTIADVSLLAPSIEPSAVGHDGVAQLAQRVRRRSSVTSSAGSLHAEKGSDFSLGSATDSQPPRESMMVKKARAPAIPRPEIAKSKAIKKQPATSVALKIGDQPATVQSSHEANKVPFEENEELKNKDVDQLVSGMTQMRIRLNVPPKEEYEARQIMSKPAPRGRPKSTTAKPAKAASPTKAKTKAVKVPPAMILEEELTPRQLPQPALVTGPTQKMPMSPPAPILPELLLQPTSGESFQPPTTSLAAPSSSTVPEFAPLSADTASKGVESIIAAPQPAQSPSSPEFVAPITPITAKRTRQDLPVFTSTSSISFGRPPNTNPMIDQAIMRDSSDQNHSNLPETPSLGPQPVLSAQSQAMTSDQPWNSRTAAEINTKEESVSSGSIWDVPDTPQVRKP